MKTFETDTSNKGTTVILDNLQQAIEFGRKAKEYGDQIYGGGAWSAYYEDSVKEILNGPADGSFMKKVEDCCEGLVEIVRSLEPSLNPSYEGFNRSESEGLAVDAGLLSSGSDQPMLKRKRSEYVVNEDKAGTGAYRIIICTDVSWWGTPEMNAGMVGAFVKIMQQFKPVEVWIQQGWLGGDKNDGVTLFKLDFAGGFDMVQLAFWVTSQYKDSPFSFLVNRGLKRKQAATSCTAEVECDLWLRGDWAKIHGFEYRKFNYKTYTEKLDMLGRWMASTARKVIIKNDGMDGIHL